MNTDLIRQAQEAKEASRVLMTAGTDRKNRALALIADALLSRKEEWLAANAEDMAAAEGKIAPAMMDRLKLSPERIEGIADGVRQVIGLPDPIGVVDKMSTRPNGLIIGRRRVPLGVIAIIYEARPNVTADAAVLCLKSGNVCILRGGKEAIRSNRAAVRIMQDALEEAGLPKGCISLVQDTSHDTANELMHLNEYVDVLIPRGGAGLIRSVVKNASIPVIRTGEGVCHVYIDREADLSMGARILFNGKCSRPSVCNAVECVLIDRDRAEEFLPLAAEQLGTKQVELRCDGRALAILRKAAENAGKTLTGDSFTYAGCPVRPAAEEDWDTEYNDYILAVRIVDSYDEAVDFINAHGTGHSEAIITNNYMTAQHFLDQIDAAAVYVNASTRFTDGGEFGLGAEIGISTQKLHARGPMGLEELTSCKYVVYGEGQIR
ncbi:MAG: glutamate-5-semialdehyde dehydrogenase [Lachnospiraceae bacterium]|nr:glutamate-5-semialdehyde dehydrogenase [Lachnospiraceae bacterium]